MSTSVRLTNHDNFIGIQSVDMSNSIDHIPAMVYNLALTERGPIMVKDRPRFEVPQRKYGKHNEYFSRLTKNYDPESRGFGVILDGEKGGGKSLLAEDLGNWMIAGDRPVIVIDYAISSQLLRMVILLVGPCMVYFDEFGKMYSEEKERDNMLTLFSDTSIRGVLFVVTSNGTNELSNFMIGRPGRFKYHINYGAMQPETALEIAEEMKVDEWKRPIIKDYVHNRSVTFDQVLTLIRETAHCKTLDEMKAEVQILNIPSLIFQAYVLDGIKINGELIDGEYIKISPVVNDQVTVTIERDLELVGEYTFDLSSNDHQRSRERINITQGNVLAVFSITRSHDQSKCTSHVPWRKRIAAQAQSVEDFDMRTDEEKKSANEDNSRPDRMIMGRGMQSGPRLPERQPWGTNHL